MVQQTNNTINRNENQNFDTVSLETITGDLISPKQAWELIKISKTRFYTLVEQGYINLIRFDYSGRKTFVRRSQLVQLFSKDFNLN